MKWKYKEWRCVRRFALFPVKVRGTDGSNGWARWTVWLEVYYVIQSRTPCGMWFNDRLTDKETWQKWRADE